MQNPRKSGDKMMKSLLCSKMFLMLHYVETRCDCSCDIQN